MNNNTNIKKVDNKIEEVLYSIKEVATLLHTSPNYVYDLVNAGMLKSIKIRSRKVRRSSLLEFLDQYEGMDISDICNIKPLEVVSNG